MTTELFEASEACTKTQGLFKPVEMCSADCRKLNTQDYMDLLWTTLAEFPGKIMPVSARRDEPRSMYFMMVFLQEFSRLSSSSKGSAVRRQWHCNSSFLPFASLSCSSAQKSKSLSVIYFTILCSQASFNSFHFSAVCSSPLLCSLLVVL